MRARQLVVSIFVGLLLVVTLLVGACSTAPAQAPSQPATTSKEGPAAQAAPASKEAPASQAAPAAKDAAASKPAAAPAKVIEMKFASLEAENSITAQAQRAWIDKIQKDAAGKVKITAYWGGTLVKPAEGFTQLTTGVYELGGALPQFAPASRFPIVNSLMYFFHGSPDYATSVKIYKEIYAKYPAVGAEFEGIKPLGVYPGAINHFFSTKKPVRRLTDLKGMMVRKGPMDMGIITSLGAEGTNLPMGETIQQLQKGTLDGAFGQPAHLKDYKIAEVVKYVTTLNFVNGPFVDISMNMNTWKSLPPDVQKVFDDNIDSLDSAFLANHGKKDQDGWDFSKQQGNELIQLPAEDVKTLSDMSAASAAKLAADLETKGIPGKKIYEDVQSLVAKYSKK